MNKRIFACNVLALWMIAACSSDDGSNASEDTQTQCPGIDLQTSRDHCGACGHACNADEICQNGTCKASGGTQTQCPGVDLQTSHDHCGACGHACSQYEQCRDGACTCADNAFDCNQDGICESYYCECELGQTEPCYDGPDSTRDVGQCRSGERTCVANAFGADWSACEGQVLPSFTYTCDPFNLELDTDCNGTPETLQDEDGDGYTICDGEGNLIDCCDNANMCRTTHPEKVNPGRIDCFGNNLDDNCSGAIDDNPEILCSSGGTVVADCAIKDRTCGDGVSWTYGEAKNASAAGALAMAKAMDMCLNIVSAESGNPGLIEFSVSPSSDYAIGMDPRQIHIKQGMADSDGNLKIPPRVGQNFILLSSGIAGDAATELKQYGLDDMKMSLGGSIPEPYRTAHANQLQTHPKCASGGADIYDTVKLHFKIRAPKDAKGIRFDFRFFSREYPYFVCSQYNDFFLSILTDEHGKPIADTNNDGALDDEDGNISFDMNGNPVSVNNAFFTTCAEAPCNGNFAKPMADQCPAMLSCDPETSTCGGVICKDGSEELAAYYPQFYTTGDDALVKRGGGTAWLTTKAPVNPGEIFNLDFYIWDTGDLKFDSTVILDNFQWECSETTVGTDFAEEIIDVN